MKATLGRVFSPTRLHCAAQATAIALAIGLAFAAHTAQAKSASEDQQACMGDVMKFCSAQIPDRTLIVSCLKRARSKLTPACREVMSSAK